MGFFCKRVSVWTLVFQFLFPYRVNNVEPLYNAFPYFVCLFFFLLQVGLIYLNTHVKTAQHVRNPINVTTCAVPCPLTKVFWLQFGSVILPNYLYLLLHRFLVHNRLIKASHLLLQGCQSFFVWNILYWKII